MQNLCILAFFCTFAAVFNNWAYEICNPFHSCVRYVRMYVRNDDIVQRHTYDDDRKQVLSARRHYVHHHHEND